MSSLVHQFKVKRIAKLARIVAKKGALVCMNIITVCAAYGTKTGVHGRGDLFHSAHSDVTWK